MRLEFAFAADYAQAHADGKLYVMGGGFQHIQVPALPYYHPNICVVMRVSFSQAECGETHTLTVTLTGPEGRPVMGPAEFPMTPALPPETHALDDQDDIKFHATLSAQTIRFDQLGRHVFTIHSGDDLLAEWPLFVAAADIEDSSDERSDKSVVSESETSS